MGPVRFKWLRRSPRAVIPMPPLMRSVLGDDASPKVVQVALTTQMMLDKEALDRQKALRDAGRTDVPAGISRRRSRWNCYTAAKIADQLRREGLIS